MTPGGRVIVGNTDMRRVPYNDTFLYYLLPHYTPGHRVDGVRARAHEPAGARR